MNDRSLRRYVLASLTLTLAPTGCATLLGLDDFKEGPGAGAGGSGGSGGMSSSSSGTGGEATSSSTGGTCVDGATMACYSGPPATEGRGPCAAGTALCQNGIYGVCTGEKLPAPEVCTVLGDENCDGISCSEARWAGIFGDSTNYHEFLSTAIDPQGNIFTAGVFTGSLKFGDLPALVGGGQDFFLVKFDAAGKPLWSKQFGDATNNGNFTKLAVDKSGNVVLAGGLNGTANFGGGATVNQGGTDIFVAKYDPSGNYKWGKTFGGAGNEIARTVAVDSQGDVLLAGSLNGTVSFGGATFTAGGNQTDGFLTKLAAANGAHVWSKHFAEATGQVNSNQWISRIAIDPADYIQVVGTFNKSANFGGAPLTTTSTLALVVARYDAAGNHNWSQAFGGTAQIGAGGVASDSLGNIVVGAILTGAIDFGGGSISAQGIYDNVCLVKFDATGALKWSKVFSDGGDDQVADISTDADNNVVVTGYMGGTPDFGGGPLANAGSKNAFLAKLDSAGMHLWSKSFGDSAAQGGTAVAVDRTTKEIVMGGVALGTIDFGTGALLPAAGTDTYGGATLAKFQP